MSSLGLKWKILGIITVILFVSSVCAFYNLLKLNKIGEINFEMYDHPFTVTTNVLEAGKNIVSMHRSMKDVVLADSDEDINRAVSTVNQYQALVLENIKIIEGQILGEQGKNLISELKRLFFAWEPIRNEVISLVKQGKKNEAALITKNKGAKHVAELITSTDKMKEYSYNNADEFKNSSIAILKHTKKVSYVLTLISIIICLVIGIFFAQSITRPVRNAIQNLNTTSAEILAAIQQQSTSAKEQAASVQQTTSSMEEISQAGRQISDRARTVSQSAESTSTASMTGIRAVEESNQTMELIRDQVEQVAENIVSLSENTQIIGEIINTVNDIAEQSNLLSLNAAIEAVGAGEHGLRFSVVVGEIKNLANKAKESTSQIRSILTEIQKGINTSVMSTEESVKRVETGKRKAGEAADSIKNLTTATQSSVQAFQQIVASTNQQQIGIEQVLEALKDIRVATTQTSASISQIEKAVSNLNELGSLLAKFI